MTEVQVREFWQNHPCGETLVGGLGADDDDAFEKFINRYDHLRFTDSPQLLANLNRLNVVGKRVLEIGLGQGADSEQLIRRGALWSGLDLTEESVKRVRRRLKLRGLPYENLTQGSALEIPYPSGSFDMVFSFGVLHHIPELGRAQCEIARVLRPGGELIAMLYAKWSLNYLLSIALLRRAGLIATYYAGIRGKGKLAGHLENARSKGLWNYLRLKNFIHANTDGPLNPFSKVYDVREVRRVFTSFELTKAYKLVMHAPPLPARFAPAVPGESLLGWNLWVHLKPGKSSAAEAESVR